MSIPKPKVFWPLTVTASNHHIPFYVVDDMVERVAAIAAGVYYSASELATAVQSAMNTALGSALFYVTVDDEGRLIIRYTGGGGDDFYFLQWTTHSSNSAAEILGFRAEDMGSEDTSYDGLGHAMRSSGVKCGWWSPLAAKTDSQDNFETPNDVVTVAVGGQNQNLTEHELTKRSVEFSFLPAVNARIAATVLDANYPYLMRRAIENWWRDGRARFRYWPDAAVEATYGDYFLDQSSLEDGFALARMRIDKEIYSTSKINMRKYVAP